MLILKYNTNISLKSVENIRETFEKGNNTNVCPGNIGSKISAFQTQISQSSVTENNNKNQNIDQEVC